MTQAFYGDRRVRLECVRFTARCLHVRSLADPSAVSKE